MNYIKYGHHISYKNFFKITFIYILVFIPIILIRYPDIRNEIKYFVIADNMIETKNFLILKYFSELYPDKPPLYFWLFAFIKKYFGNNFIPLAAGLGSTLPSYLITVMSYSLFSKIKDEKTGFMISLILCTMPFFIGISVFLRMDMMMSFFIFMALSHFFNIYYDFYKKTFINISAVYLFVFLGIFTKGIAGFIVPISIIFGFLILEKNINFLKKIHFGKGILSIIFLIGLWIYFIFLMPEGKNYISLMLGQETVGRIIKSKAHIQPFYYYFIRLPLLTFPYEIFLFGGIISYLKNMKHYSAWTPLEKIGFVWTVIPLILFSFASGKLDIYLLPVFPGITVTIYNFVMKIKDTEAGQKIIKVSMILSVLPLILNKIFNKENNFYKKIFMFPVAVIILFTGAGQCMKIYNEKFTLKSIKQIIETSGKNPLAYKFPDFKNMETELKKSVALVSDKNEFINSENFKNIIVISRIKYENDLKNIPDLKLIFQNKNYAVYLKKEKL